MAKKIFSRKTAKAPSVADDNVHPLAKRCAENAWTLLRMQHHRYANPHQLGKAAAAAGLAAKNTIRHVFYPEHRPTGKQGSPTAPTLDSLDATARMLGYSVHDLLDPQLEQTLQMRASFSTVLAMSQTLLEANRAWLKAAQDANKAIAAATENNPSAGEPGAPRSARPLHTQGRH